MMTTPPVVEVAAPPQLPDRRGWLIAFGILEIAIAFVLLGMIGLMLLGVAMAGRLPNQPPPNFRVMLQSASIYTLACVFFAVMGIGSIQARRWARSLMLAASWVWLLGGAVGTLTAAYVVPRMLKAEGAPPAPEGVLVVVVAIMLLFGIFAFVALPLTMLLFYRGAAVRATCERLDPVPRWTDRLPQPVLILVVVLAYHALTFFVMAFAMPIVSFFGTFVTGIPGSILYVLLAALWGYLTWSNSRLHVNAWRATLIAQTLFAFSAILTFVRADAVKAYAAMGMDAAQSARSAALLKNPVFCGGILALAAAFVIYIICLRKYYPTPSTATNLTPQA